MYRVLLGRLAVTGMVAGTVVTAGCSSGSATQTGSPTPTSSQPTSSAPGGSFDEATCLDISFAKDGLMVAANPASARTPADTLEKFGPPDQVKAAIEHFVTTGGAQPNDPDIDANRKSITGWIKQQCPNVNP